MQKTYKDLVKRDDPTVHYAKRRVEELKKEYFIPVEEDMEHYVGSRSPIDWKAIEVAIAETANKFFEDYEM